MNTVALVVSIIGSITVETSPLSAVQMLWVNLIMDSFAALALATESPKKQFSDTKPFGRSEKMINFDMYVTIITQSLFQINALLLILYLAPHYFDIIEG